MKSYLSEYSFSLNNVDQLMSWLEEQAVELCANAVMEFSYSALEEGHGLRGSGVAVCNPRLGTPCC